MSKTKAWTAIHAELLRAEKKFPLFPTDPVHAAAIVADALKTASGLVGRNPRGRRRPLLAAAPQSSGPLQASNNRRTHATRTAALPHPAPRKTVSDPCHRGR